MVKSNMVWGHITREVLLMAENWLQVCRLETDPRQRRKFNCTAACQAHLIVNCNCAFFFLEKKIVLCSKEIILFRISPEVRMNYFTFGIILGTDQRNCRLRERVNTKENLAEFFALLLFSGDHGPFLEGAFSQTW